MEKREKTKCTAIAREPGLVSMAVGPRAGWPLCRWVCPYLSVGGRAVGTGAGSVTVREQSVSLIGPPRPQSTITLLCLSPASPWQHHMIALKEWESSCCVCMCVFVCVCLSVYVCVCVLRLSLCTSIA